MRFFILPLFLCLFGTETSGLMAQTLPDEMYISADGRRLITGGRATYGFYDESVIREVRFDFPQSNYWTLLTNNYRNKIPILAKMTIDGEVFDSVGVRFKGQTSYMGVQNSQKKSFAVDLDFVRAKQDVGGYETLNFNNGYLDHTFIREVLYLHLGRQHIPSAKGSYIHLTINGADWGLYNNVQGLNGDYLKEWFLSDNGTRWRAERTTSSGTPGGGGGFGAGTSSLNWLGADTTLYKPHYTLKTAHKTTPWTDLVNTCRVLNTTPANLLEDSLKKYLDIDRTLWFLATEIAFTDDDSYVFKGGMDYYLYWEPETGRMVPLEYDGNTCMELPAATDWPPFYKQTDTRFALTNKLFPVPALRQRYLAHLRTILEDSFRPGFTDSIVDAYAKLIRPRIESDPKKLYTTTQFEAGVSELKSFFNARRNYLLANAEVAAAVPAVGNVEYASGNGLNTPPAAGKPVTVTARATSAAGINAVWLYYSTDLVGWFRKTRMFDDGQHGDGAPNDGNFGGEIPGYSGATYVRYYVEAVNNTPARSVAYAPKGAEHDVFIYQVDTDLNSAAEVVINEMMASNTTTAADPNGEYDDWIEFFNKGNQAADLGGWSLSDDPDRPEKWKFPAGTTLPAGGYLIVWCDENGMQPGLHANFKLSASGETVWLRNPAGAIIQEVTFGLQTTDKGYARVPNGTGSFKIQNPSFNANNNSVSAGEAPSFAFKIYPNPANGYVTFEADDARERAIEITSPAGIKVWEGTLQGRLFADVSRLPAGVYFVRTGNAVQRLVLTVQR
jgi:hypothetical protein